MTCCMPACPRAIRWAITARDGDHAALIVIHACDWHGDQARQQAWQADHVQMIEMRQVNAEVTP